MEWQGKESEKARELDDEEGEKKKGRKGKRRRRNGKPDTKNPAFLLLVFSLSLFSFLAVSLSFLNVEPYVDDVPVLHYIIAPFCP